MTPADVRSGVRSAWAFIQRVELDEALSSFVPLGVDEQFRDIALDPDRRYEEVYLTGLAQSHYNFVLRDYSYFQFSCDVRDEYRFAFLPNPFLSTTAAGELGDLQDYVREGAMTLDEYLHRISELRAGQYPPPIRYENSPRHYKKYIHPQSHFHIGHHGENRWPLDRELTVTAFTTMIVKYFYGRAWGDAKHVDAQSGLNALETTLATEKARCQLVSVARFSADERAQFFHS